MDVDTLIRLGTTDDLHFVISNMAATLSTTYPNQYALNYFTICQQHIRQLCQSSLVLIQHESSDPNDIVSYLIYTSFHNQLVVHYAYTKWDARRQGKLKELIEFANPNGSNIIFTHPAKNENAMKYFASKHIFDPNLPLLLHNGT